MSADQLPRRSTRVTRPTVKAMENKDTEEWIKAQRNQQYIHGDDGPSMSADVTSQRQEPGGETSGDLKESALKHEPHMHGDDDDRSSRHTARTECTDQKQSRSVTKTRKKSSRRSVSSVRTSSSRQSKVDELYRKANLLEQELLTTKHETELMELGYKEEERRVQREIREKRIKQEEERMLREEVERHAQIQFEADLEKKRKTMKILEMQESLRRTQEEIENASEGSTSSRSTYLSHNDQQQTDYRDANTRVYTKAARTSIPPPGMLPQTHHDSALQTAQIAKMFADSINISRLPIPQPDKFSGDSLTFSSWKSSVSILIESKGIPSNERIHYLKRYLDGDAKVLVNTLFDLNDAFAYDKAIDLLAQRYGSTFLITEAYRDKLESWPKILAKDGKGLRKYGDFLQQCLIAMETVKGLSILNDCRENRKMLTKIPEHMLHRWSRQISGLTDYPKFDAYVKFITKEAEILCNPITNFRDNLEADSKKRYSNAHSRTAFANDTDEQPKDKCSFCDSKEHSLHDCTNFMHKTPQERSEFIMKMGYCFHCLKRGHMARKCTNRSMCEKCSYRHPTCLHGDWEKLKMKDEKHTSKTQTDEQLSQKDEVRS